MKTTLTLLGLSLLVQSLPGANENVIALASQIDAPIANKVYPALVALVRNAPDGTALRFIAGNGDFRTLAEITKKKYPNRPVEDNALQPVFTALKASLFASVRQNEGRPATGVIDVVGLMQTMHDRGRPMSCLILVGGTAWSREGDPSTAFFDDSAKELDQRLRRPSHAHFSADRLVSPFSTQGLADGRLAGVRVLWLDPMDDAASGGFNGREIHRDFWRTYLLTGLGVAAVRFDTDAAEIVKAVTSELPSQQPPMINPAENTVEMLTLAQLKAAVKRKPALPALTDIFVVDFTSSMGPYHETVARNIAVAQFGRGRRYAIVGFTDYENETNRVAFLYSEHSDPAELASAFRQAPLIGGVTIPEALGEGLKVAKDMIAERALKAVEITIYTDARAKRKDECPPDGADYLALTADLLAGGHSITLVACGGLETSWVPRGVKIKRL